MRALRDAVATAARAGQEAHRDLTVVFIPDMRLINPYQDLLALALEQRGIRVRYPSQLGESHPLPMALLSGRFDVIHLHWLHPYLAARTLWGSVLRGTIFLSKVTVARFLRRRIVWTVHNLVSHEARFPGWEKRVNERLARLAHVIVVHYPDARRIVRDTFRVPARKPILVAPHGHYLDVYDKPTDAQSGLPPHGSIRPLVILAFGLVRPYKRLEDLIVAFKDLDREDVSLKIRGGAHDESYASELRRLAEEDDRISLELDFVDDREVAGVFAAADIVACTQADTLTSGSLILAMSMGKPIVAARGPHAEFLLGDGREGGHLYPSGETAELTTGLEEMVSRRHQLSEMGAANRRRIARYTWSGTAEAMERAYRGLD
jgi:beta-1,4-mannosyltransferase